jgi:hypothetical protein
MRIHGPGSNEIFSILLVESHKLDLMTFKDTLDEDPWSRVQ